MDVTCSCGEAFQAKSPRALYCSDRCRKRRQRSAAAAVVVVELPTTEPVHGDGRRGPVERAAILELTVSGRLDTVLGQTCLALARRVDRPGLDTGSALAAVAERLRVMLAEATRGVAKPTAPQQLSDELAVRRAKHGA